MFHIVVDFCAISIIVKVNRCLSFIACSRFFLFFASSNCTATLYRLFLMNMFFIFTSQKTGEHCTLTTCHHKSAKCDDITMCPQDEDYFPLSLLSLLLSRRSLPPLCLSFKFREETNILLFSVYFIHLISNQEQVTTRPKIVSSQKFFHEQSNEREKKIHCNHLKANVVKRVFRQAKRRRKVCTNY